MQGVELVLDLRSGPRTSAPVREQERHDPVDEASDEIAVGKGVKSSCLVGGDVRREICERGGGSGIGLRT